MTRLTEEKRARDTEISRLKECVSRVTRDCEKKHEDATRAQAEVEQCREDRRGQARQIARLEGQVR